MAFGFTDALKVANPAGYIGYKSLAGGYDILKGGTGGLGDYNPFSEGSAVKEKRRQQEEYLKTLQAAAAGGVPSAAESQFKTSADRLVADQYALAASQPGLAPAAGLRQASLGASSIGTRLAGDAATLRAQEQATARGQLAAALNQAYEQAAAERKRKIDLASGLLKQGGSALATGGAAGAAPVG